MTFTPQSAREKADILEQRSHGLDMLARPVALQCVDLLREAADTHEASHRIIKEAVKIADARGEFLQWLVSLDDPESAQGLQDRQTVTLNAIIERARAALES